MSTQAILNPANILTTPVPASGGSQAASESPEVPFNQVLQREVTGRRDNEQPVKATSKEKENKAAPAQAASGQAPTQTQKAESSHAAGKKGTEPSEDGSEKLENAAATSAELLALVSNMVQINTPQSTAAEVTAGQAAASDLALTTGVAEGIVNKLVTDKLSGKAETADMAGQKPDPNATQSFADIVKNIGQNHVAAERQASPSLTAAESGNISIQNITSIPDQDMALQDMTLQEHATTLATSPLTSMQQALNKIQPSFAADKLSPPVGTPAWDQAVGQKVVWMVAGGQQSASLTLNPPDLGPLQVVLNVNNSQANATFVAAQPEVRQALEAALPKLREMLGDAGIQLGQASVSAGHSQQGNSFSNQQQQRQASGHMGQDDKQALQPAHGLRQQIIKSGNGMVDTFA